MAHYRYKAMDYRGQNTNGLVEAPNIEDARARLSERNLFVSAIKVTRDNAQAGNFVERYQGKRSQQELVLFTRQLYTLIMTGVPITEAIDALALEMKDKNFKEVLIQIRDSILEGRSLSEAMAEHPNVFSKVYLGLIQVGQASGQMDLVLQELSKFLYKQNELKKNFVSAMIYPALLTFVGSTVITIIMMFIIPNITDVLEQGGQELPASTQILVHISDAFGFAFPYLIFFSVLSFIAGIFLLKDDKIKLKWDTFILKIPMLGKLLSKALMARFSMTFAILLRSGVTALDSLEVLEETTENFALKNAIRSIREDLVAGSDISSRVHDHGIFPHLMGFMISVGERSGKLDDVLHYISTHYEEDLEYEIDTFTSVFEPVMIVTMATIIGVIIFAVVSAILQMSKFS